MEVQVVLGERWVQVWAQVLGTPVQLAEVPRRVGALLVVLRERVP